jgi:hypothetical protein
MANKTPEKLTREQRVALERLEFTADKIARQQCKKYDWLRNETDAVANFALAQLHASMKRMVILNPDAFLMRSIINRINDLGRRYKVKESRLQFLESERPSKSGGDGGIPRHQGTLGGLSIDFIKKENRRVASLKVAAVVAIMPDEYDQKLLAERFYDDEVTVTELAHRHGKAPNAMANYLQKILGGNGNTGAVEPVYQMMDRLSIATATAFVKILQEYNDRDILTDPIAGAVSHLEFAGSYSEAHRQLAVLGVARLRWLERHEVCNSGLTNKLLNRLVKAACFYVHEVDDARHDRMDARGLQDDVNVLDVVSQVVREFQTK